MNFDKLGLTQELLDAVSQRGYTKATPIQAQAIPAVLEGKDVMGGAQTGTGKTAAFALPILHKLHKNPVATKEPRALILTPTRELAAQVHQSFVDYGKNVSIKSNVVFGGVKINPQIDALKRKTDVIVATPGRLLDHVSQGTVDLSKIEIFVLDEADRMLDMGFIRDIQRIQKVLPKKRQSLLFSATYSKDIRILAEGILRQPVHCEVAQRNQTADNVLQVRYAIDKTQKRHLLEYLIKKDKWYRVLVFVRTKHGANRLTKQLLKADIPCAAIHGDKSQNARTKALAQFQKGDLQALIATDVAARGIHLEELGHVVNFDLPQVPEDYVHRIGRTGRAGKSGTAISFISSDEKEMWTRIEKLLKTSVEQLSLGDFKPVKNVADPDSSFNRGRSPQRASSRGGSSQRASSRGGSSQRASSRGGSPRSDGQRSGSSGGNFRNNKNGGFSGGKSNSSDRSGANESTSSPKRYGQNSSTSSPKRYGQNSSTSSPKRYGQNSSNGPDGNSAPSRKPKPAGRRKSTGGNNANNSFSSGRSGAPRKGFRG